MTATSKRTVDARSGAVVLCGGKSTRMGRPKAWLPWFGRTLIEHVVWNLQAAVDQVIVVTSKELDLPPLDAQIIRDRDPALGPLAGIREGLAAADAAGIEFAFVTSTDAPFVTSAGVRSILGHGRAAAPVADGFVQVLSAVYPASAWQEAGRMLAAAASGSGRAAKARPVALLESLDYLALPVSDFSEPFPWSGFNSPDEYFEAARRVEPEAAAAVELLGVAAQGQETTRRRVPIGPLGDVLAALELPESLGLVEDGRVAKRYLVSLNGRELVRDLALPVGPGERVSIIDALAGG